MVILGRNINCHHQSASPDQCMAVYGHYGGHNGGIIDVNTLDRKSYGGFIGEGWEMVLRPEDGPNCYALHIINKYELSEINMHSP